MRKEKGIIERPHTLLLLFGFLLILSLAVIAGCGGGGGGDGGGGTTGDGGSGPAPTIVDCGGAGSTGTLSAIVLYPNGSTPIAAATVGVSGVAGCSGLTGTGGTIEFRRVPVGTYTVTVQAGMFSTNQGGVSVSAGGTGSISLALSATAKRLGVIAGDYDLIEDVLTRLGFVWVYITKATLTNAATLNTYDGIFLNCGMDRSDILDLTTANNVAPNLRNFLTSGTNKRLYASDWAYIYLERAFPAAIDFYSDDNNYDITTYNQARVGVAGTITATVNDSYLATTLGRSNMSVTFDLDWWAAINLAGPGTATLISGDVTVWTSASTTYTYTNRPLMVSFPYGVSGGRVNFTSFHTEAQPYADMDRVMERIIAY